MEGGEGAAHPEEGRDAGGEAGGRVKAVREGHTAESCADVAAACADDASREALIEAGVVDALAEVVAKGAENNAGPFVQATNALKAVCKGDKAAKDLVVQSGAPKNLLAHLLVAASAPPPASKSDEQWEWTCAGPAAALLANLCVGSKEFRAAVRGEGGIAAATAAASVALADPDAPESKADAADCLLSFLVNATYRNAKASKDFRSSSGVAVINAALAAGVSTKRVVLGLKLAKRLSVFGQGKTALASALESIVRNLRQKVREREVEAVEVAAPLVTNLTWQHRLCQDLFRVNGGIVALVALISAPVEAGFSPKAVGFAAEALANASAENRENAEALGMLGALEPLVHTVNRIDLTSRARGAAVFAVYRASLAQSNTAELVRLGAIGKLVEFCEFREGRKSIDRTAEEVQEDEGEGADDEGDSRTIIAVSEAEMAATLALSILARSTADDDEYLASEKPVTYPIVDSVVSALRIRIEAKKDHGDLKTLDYARAAACLTTGADAAAWFVDAGGVEVAVSMLDRTQHSVAVQLVCALDNVSFHSKLRPALSDAGVVEALKPMVESLDVKMRSAVRGCTARLMGEVPDAQMASAPDTRYAAFISHRQRDAKDFARQLYNLLQSHGLNSFLDKASLENVSDLPALVSNSDNFIFVLSDGVLESQWCLEELKAAVAADCNIVLVVKDGSRWKDHSGNFTATFPGPNVIEALPKSVRSVFEKLAVPHSDDYYDAFVEKLLSSMKLPATAEVAPRAPLEPSGAPPFAAGASFSVMRQVLTNREASDSQDTLLALLDEVRAARAASERAEAALLRQRAREPASAPRACCCVQ